jgi:hypothetical protein
MPKLARFASPPSSIMTRVCVNARKGRKRVAELQTFDGVERENHTEREYVTGQMGQDYQKPRQDKKRRGKTKRRQGSSSNTTQTTQHKTAQDKRRENEKDKTR